MGRKRIVIATIKSWNIEKAQSLQRENADLETHIITDKDSLTVERLSEIRPEYVFFPHWSWMIPKEIYANYDCIVFHMTDLPFGRGGSPLQNLIARGIYSTKISAIQVTDGLDCGDVYMKRPLDLKNGSATDIFKKASDIVFQMIEDIVRKKPLPHKQEGKVIVFKRRTPEESALPLDESLVKVYDWIRMLDAESYPRAFI